MSAKEKDLDLSNLVTPNYRYNGEIYQLQYKPYITDNSIKANTPIDLRISKKWRKIIDTKIIPRAYHIFNSKKIDLVPILDAKSGNCFEVIVFPENKSCVNIRITQLLGSKNTKVVISAYELLKVF